MKQSKIQHEHPRIKWIKEILTKVFLASLGRIGDFIPPKPTSFVDVDTYKIYSYGGSHLSIDTLGELEQ